MKIATLTFTDTSNYGALLQAYALQQYLNDTGNECEVINYQNKARKFSQVSGIRKIRSVVWHYSFAPLFENKKRKKQTEWFRNNVLNLTHKIYKNSDALRTLNSSVDCFVVGSDQVWNPQNNGFDDAFFLSFANEEKKRISYAASLGSADGTYLKSKSDMILRINDISVREKQSADLFESVLGISVKTVIDPVFLLSKEEWINHLNLSSISTSVNTDSGYVLCYVMPGDQEIVEKIYSIAEFISNEEGIRIITLGKKNYAKAVGKETLDGDAGPEEFLKYVKDAAYVVTNSFHGTALSIVFRRQFYSVLKKGNKRNNRIEDLLHSIYLSERIVYSDTVFKKSVDSRIDFTRVDQTLSAEINKSKQFLERAIEEGRKKNG